MEYWHPVDNFKDLPDFLDLMPGSSRVTEPEWNLRSSSPLSISSARMASFHGTRIQIYQAQDQNLEALEQQMEVISVLLAQSGQRKEKLFARALAQLQFMSALVWVHFESVTINIPNNAEVEPMAPPTIDMGVDPKFLDTTTIGVANFLPVYYVGDNGLLEGNPCSSDMKNELITTLHSTSPMNEERVPLIPNSCSATTFG